VFDLPKAKHSDPMKQDRGKEIGGETGAETKCRPRKISCPRKKCTSPESKETASKLNSATSGENWLTCEGLGKSCKNALQRIMYKDGTRMNRSRKRGSSSRRQKRSRGPTFEISQCRT